MNEEMKLAVLIAIDKYIAGLDTNVSAYYIDRLNILLEAKQIIEQLETI